jgi:hypothetical protein
MNPIKKLVAAISAAFSIFSAYADVYYVTPEADGTGGGTSWSDATTLAGANAKVKAGDTIRMKAGPYTMTARVQVSKAITIEGGYKGEIDKDLTLADNPETVLDGANSSSVTEPIYVRNDSGTNYFYRLAFTRFYRRGFLKYGNASLEMYNCRFANNGPKHVLTRDQNLTFNEDKLGGRGALFWGSSSSSYLTLSNCVFEDNIYEDASSLTTNDYPGYGSGAFVANFKRVYMDDCLFKGNGYPVTKSTVKARHGKASAIYLYKAPITAVNTRFIGNSFVLGYEASSGCVELSTSCGGSVFKNCAWVGNKGSLTDAYSAKTLAQAAIVVALGSVEQAVDFENCTIAYNLMGARTGAAGLIVSSGIANVRDSIIYGNVIFRDNKYAANVTDPDVASISTSGTLNLVNTLTTNDGEGLARISRTAALNGDPLFVTPLSEFYSCINVSVSSQIHGSKGENAWFKAAEIDRVMNLDVHLLSADGYFDNSGKYYPKGSTDVSSIAIDAGAVDSDYSKEPMPNGGVVNLGCYGNTPEASNSPSGGQPTLAADDVVVTFTEYGKPTVMVTPKAADSSVKYKAAVLISVTGKVKGGGIITEEIKVFDFAQAGITPGSTVTMPIEEIFEPSSQLLITVNVVADGAQNIALEKTVLVAGSLPEYYGRGNRSVVHYWADAPGRNDGSSWVNAYRDLSSAIRALSAEKSELWIAGSNVLHASTATLASSFNSTIRGGFTAYCDSIEDREEGAISVIDGDNKYAPFAVSVSSGFTCFMERMKICRSGSSNMTKSGAGSLQMSNCIISDCSMAEKGSGIYLAGGENTFDSCQFKNLQYLASYYNNAGAAMYVEGANKVILENCEFERNGNLDKHNSQRATGGVAVYSLNTPIIARNCRFVGNVERSYKDSDKIFYSAGCVTLDANCGGSAFTNCLWLGNCGTYCNDGKNLGTSTNTAAVVVNLSSASSTVDFANCTFAYNMSDSALSPTGILMLKGTGSAVNSIFTGAVTGTCSRVANQVYVNKGSSMTLDYCMFDAEGDYGAAEGGTVTASNIMYADPRLVYSRDDFATGGNVDMVNGIYKSNGSGINSVLANANAHLRGRPGYTDENTGLFVRGSGLVPSPAIDAGKPGYDYSLEPVSNGRRVNLGFYGNTPWATLSARHGLSVIVR